MASRLLDHRARRSRWATPPPGARFMVKVRRRQGAGPGGRDRNRPRDAARLGRMNFCKVFLKVRTRSLSPVSASTQRMQTWWTRSAAKPASSLDRRIAPVAASTAGTPVAPVADGSDKPRSTPPPSPRPLARPRRPRRSIIDASPRIKKAIANGDYPDPAARTIADRLLGAHALEWNAPDEPA